MVKSERNIVIEVKRVTQVLAGLVVALVVLNLIALGFRYAGHPRVLGFVPEFLLRREGNVPTYFSSMLLFMASSLLGLIALLKGRDCDCFARQWKILAFIFLYLSVDEMATLHERLNRPVAAVFDVGGLLRYGWVVVVGLLVAIFAVAYLRFLNHLPAKPKRLFVMAGVLYVGGALGVEMVGAWYTEGTETRGLVYDLLTTVEEIGEMSGVLVFIYALLGYVQHEFEAVRLQFDK